MILIKVRGDYQGQHARPHSGNKNAPQSVTMIQEGFLPTVISAFAVLVSLAVILAAYCLEI